MKTAIVITTVQEPTACVKALADCARSHQLPLIVIGDRKGPEQFQLTGCEFVPIDKQRELPFRLAPLLPEKHYARKNLGYLLAISRGFDCIYETDDDNAPTGNWKMRSIKTSAYPIQQRSSATWANIYEAYTSELIWPRGFPLSQIRRTFADNFEVEGGLVQVVAPIQQGLANGSPDVDAVWRLVLDHEIAFNDSQNTVLPRGIWCPFNSQNTWWWSEVFLLLYLPSYCSFRMTDIWRSFIAQRCLWELDYELEFHQADVKQTRNEHNLMRDFDDEVVGYLRNEEIRSILESCDLLPGKQQLSDNLRRCYEALVRAKVVGIQELELVNAWIDDCSRARTP